MADKKTTAASLRAYRTPKRSTRLFGLAALFAAGVFTFFYRSGLSSSFILDTPIPPTSQHVFNRTLGFQSIFTIGLPSRTDRHDIMALAASVSGIDMKWIPGVSEDEIDAKVISEDWKESKGAIGCWRAHMNALVHMIESDVQTALIIEDDTDWDVSLRQQLAHFATGVNTLQDLTHPAKYSSQLSPYGSSWDLLWLGHCRAGPHDFKQPIFLLENDATVPPIPFRAVHWHQSHIPAPVLSNTTRLIFRANSGMCTYAYAVTLAGARKLVAALTDNNVAWDIALSNMCREKKGKSFVCYAPYPPLMASHRFAGSRGRNSDVRPDRPKAATRNEFTRDIVYPVMLNIKRLVMGETRVKSQWPGHTADSWGVDQKLKVHGRVEWMDFSQMKETWVNRINSIADGVPAGPGTS